MTAWVSWKARAFLTIMLVGALPACAPFHTGAWTGVIGGGSKNGQQKITVKKGDTFYSLARKHDVAVQSLIKANKAEPPYELTVGQSVIVPSETLHRVGKGDTLYSVSRRYGVSVTALARQNKLAEPYTLKLGSRLAIPSGGKEIAAPTKTARNATRNARTIKSKPPPKKTRVASASPKRKTTRASGGKKFIKPVNGRVVSDYGPKSGGRHNDGINIAAPHGAPVKAAQKGVVVYVGNELKGYGNLVLIRHSDGWVSAYAHLSRFEVEPGTRVKQGEVIGRVGKSGSVTTPQVHFEIRKGSRAVNPSGLMS